jgi:hypothetical protein
MWFLDFIIFVFFPLSINFTENLTIFFYDQKCIYKIKKLRKKIKIMQKILKFLVLFLFGFLDSINLKRVLEYFLCSKKIRQLFIYCFLLNAVLFTGMILTYEFFMNYIVMSNNIIGDFLIQFKWLFTIVYYPFLLVVYLISFILSSFWFLDIAEEAISIERRFFENKNFESVKVDNVTRIRNEIIRILLVLLFFVQILVCTYIPYIGPLIELLHYSFLYSLYCFEYKWGTDSYLQKNLAFFEQNAAYFMGFGFIFALCTKFFPFLLSTGIYAILFPIFVLTAVRATPPAVNKENIKDYFKFFWGKKTLVYLTIKNFDYDDEKYLNSELGYGVFYFCRKGIKGVEMLLESMLRDKID